MDAKAPVTARMGISQARAKLTSLVNGVREGETRIIIEKSGIPVAVLVSPADLARLERLARNDARDWAVVDEISARFAGVSEDELMREAVEAVQTVRATRKAEREAERRDSRHLETADRRTIPDPIPASVGR